MNRIEWVFFDVGNVLFNDDPQNCYLYQCLHRRLQDVRPHVTFADLLCERERHALQGANWILHKIACQTLEETEIRALFAEARKTLLPNYDRFHLINEGVFDVLDRLKQRYRLGIIANQPPECRHSLRRRRLLDSFDIVAISEELDLHKPDVALYRWALEQADAPGKRTIMIGDRRDNDVAPARELSMRTILLQWDGSDGKNWFPEDLDAQAFLDSCNRVPLFSAAVTKPEPDQTVTHFTEIPAAVAAIDG